MAKSIFDQPRYAENPIYLFVEHLILDVIGHLPSTQDISDLDFQKLLGVEADSWQEAVRKSQQLSETIDMAILDLWYRNQHLYDDPWHFAQEFVDHYYEEDSQVDVWGPGDLEAASERIIQAQSKAK
jgi:hypothetical protein